MSDRSANTEAEDGLVDEEEDIKKHLRTMAEQKNWIKVWSMLLYCDQPGAGWPRPLCRLSHLVTYLVFLTYVAFLRF